jgi:hypothetical protein
MSAREDKGGLIQRRAAAEIDDEFDLREALQFARGLSSRPRLPVTAAFEEDANALEVRRAETMTTGRESKDAVAQRLAMRLEFRALAKLGETMPPQRTMMHPTAMASPRALPPRAEPSRTS